MSNAFTSEATRMVEDADCVWLGISLTFDDRPVPFVEEGRRCVACGRARGQRHEPSCPTIRLEKGREQERRRR